MVDMKKIEVAVESNDSDGSNHVAILLRIRPQFEQYQIEAYTCEPFEYKRLNNGVYFVDAPVYGMKFYYHFPEFASHSRAADFQELGAFAKRFAAYIRDAMTNSGGHEERLAIPDNSAEMRACRQAVELELATMRNNLGPSYKPNLFKAPANSAEKTHSTIANYLIGIGLVTGLCALLSTGGLAIALACIAAVLVVAGLLLKTNCAGLGDKVDAIQFASS